MMKKLRFRVCDLLEMMGFIPGYLTPGFTATVLGFPISRHPEGEESRGLRIGKTVLPK